MFPDRQIKKLCSQKRRGRIESTEQKLGSSKVQ